MNIYKSSTESLEVTTIMKRKLDEDGIPKAADTSDVPKDPPNFNVFGLEPRLLQAVAQQNFITPTLVQSRTIPLVLEGKDVLGIMNPFSGRKTQ